MGVLSELNVVKNMLGGYLNNKAKFNIENVPLPIYVQFNPESYSVQEEVSYEQVKAQQDGQEVTQFVGAVQSVTSLSFRFDTNSVITSSADSLSSIGSAVMSAANSVMNFASSLTKSETLDVSALTAQFGKLLRVDGDLHRPPNVRFTWGSIVVEGVVVSMNTTFTMFDQKGVPVQAQVDCQIMSIGSESALKKNPLFSPDRTKSRVMSEDINLWGLAASEYGDINKWRVIARANQIMDPLDLEPGTLVKVPALTDL